MDPFEFGQLLHPGVDIFDLVVFLKMQDKDISLLISNFEGANLLLADQLLIQFVLG